MNRKAVILYGVPSSTRDRRAHLALLAPAIIAAVMVLVFAVQSYRAVQSNRRAVEVSLRDYSAFAAWQYSRRASDYLRLILTATFPFANANTAYPIVAEGAVKCSMSDASVSITRNGTAFDDATLIEALKEARRRGSVSRFALGVVPIRGADGKYLAVWDRPGQCEAMVVTGESLVPILRHVAAFAPILPRNVTGNLPNDSVVSIRVLSAAGTELARIGPDLSSRAATDTLGPDLGGIRVEVKLHPAAIARLSSGADSASRIRGLFAMLVLTFVLGAIALWQLRRSYEFLNVRSDFVAAVSHELKTPLTQISLFADTLATRERSPEERATYLGIISREARRLGNLVDSVMYFARMNRGERPKESREPSLLNEELAAVVASFQPLANGRGVKIVTQMDRPVEAPIDRDAFRQLMINVLDNALKYGPDGQTITVSVGQSGGFAQIAVADEGPGIPPEDRGRIFEPFVRADRNGSRAGSGIGLAVVSDIVARHGGSVTAEGEERGARIVIRLPASGRPA